MMQHKNHTPHTFSPISGIEAPFEIKSKNGMSSLAGSLIQIRLSVRTFAVALHADSDILTAAFPSINGPHSPKKVPKGEIGRFSEDYEMLDYMMKQNYTTYPPSPSSSPSPPITPLKSDNGPRTENSQGLPGRGGR